MGRKSTGSNELTRLKKLTVAKLKEELTSKGLDATGTKPVLIERLMEAIGKEESSQEHAETAAKVFSVNVAFFAKKRSSPYFSKETFIPQEG